jgi:transcriptional regulator with XRE-family HTH domain
LQRPSSSEAPERAQRAPERDITPSVALTLRQMRDARDISLRTLATEVGIHAPHLSEIERGQRMVTPEQLARLSEFYGVDVAGWHLMLVHAG